jgi:LPS-assembly protein
MPPSAAPARSLLLLALALAFEGGFAADMSLRPSTQLTPPAPKDKQFRGATHIEADRMEGRGEDEILAEGRVVARNQREQMEADWLRYDRAKDEVEARGHVVFSQENDRLRGSLLTLKLTDRLGELRDVEYSFTGRDAQTGRGGAKVLHFEGPDKYRLEDSSYTTCPAGNQDWLLRTEDLDLDYPNNLGVARKVRVEFKDTPILYTPWVDFALDERRKTGFLAPSYGASDKGGLELLTPWYWNMAPNRDLTLYPREIGRAHV